MATVTTNASGQTIYQSRWGFYPCSYEDFLRFKVLHKQAWGALKQAMKHYRWVRKEPQNRRGIAPEVSEVQVKLRLDDLDMKEYYQGLLLQYRRARMPVSTPNEVPVIASVDVWEREFA